MVRTLGRKKVRIVGRDAVSRDHDLRGEVYAHRVEEFGLIHDICLSLTIPRNGPPL